MLESKNSSAQQSNYLDDQLRAGLEYRVLELVIAGYEMMLTDHRYDSEWKENKYTAVLRHYIGNHCKAFSKKTKKNWYVEREHYHDNEDTIYGEGDPDTVPRIDIVILTWTPDYDEIKFPFECKLIAENDTTLIRLYIKQGLIDRFLTDKDYADGSNWGGMIGYILQGEHTKIVNKLNEQINKQLSEVTSHLYIRQSPKPLETIYNSVHKFKDTDRDLKVTHLLLPFVEPLSET